MKFVLTLLIVQSTIIRSHPQVPPDQDSIRLNLQTRSDRQRTTAWVLIGGGTLIAISGLLLLGGSNSFLSGNDPQTELGGALFLTGIASDLGSIPLFISASKNARKATRITISDQKILLPGPVGLFVQRLPSFTLKISLGRRKFTAIRPLIYLPD